MLKLVGADLVMRPETSVPSAKKHHPTTQSADDTQNRTIASDTEESISSLLVHKFKLDRQSPQLLLTRIASWVKF